MDNPSTEPPASPPDRRRNPRIQVRRPPSRQWTGLRRALPAHIRIPASALPRRLGYVPWPTHRWVAAGLGSAGLVVMAGIIVNLIMLPAHPPQNPLPDVATEVAQLRTRLGIPRCTASNGLFSILQPPGWTLGSGDDAVPNGIRLRSPNGVSVTLTASRVSYNDLPSLYNDIRGRERDWGVHIEPEAIYFLGQPAVQREVPLAQSRLIVIDFVANRVAHHLMCEIPAPLVESYRSPLTEWLGTYHPGN